MSETTTKAAGGLALPTAIETPTHAVRISSRGGAADTMITVDGVEQKDVIRFEVACAVMDAFPVLALYRVVPRAIEIEGEMEIVERFADEAQRNLRNAVVNSFGLHSDETGVDVIHHLLEDAARYRALRGAATYVAARVEGGEDARAAFTIAGGEAGIGQILDHQVDDLRRALKAAGCWPLDRGSDRVIDLDTPAPADPKTPAPDATAPASTPTLDAVRANPEYEWKDLLPERDPSLDATRKDPHDESR